MRPTPAAARSASRSTRVLRRGTDLFAIYTEDVARYPLLTREEEAALGAQARSGDVEAQNRLVVHNLRFVITVAKEYWKPHRRLMDLIQDGNLGLAKAARRFNPETGARFCQYARDWVHQEICFGLGETSDDVRLKRGRRQLVRRIERLQATAEVRLQRSLSVTELATETRRSVEVIVDAVKHTVEVVSLAHPIDNDSKRTLADILPTADSVEAQETLDDQATTIARAMRDARLTPRERSVVEAYCGLGPFRDAGAQTLEEIGTHYHVSRERIRQVRDKALKKIAAQLLTLGPVPQDPFHIAAPSSHRPGTNEDRELIASVEPSPLT